MNFADVMQFLEIAGKKPNKNSNFDGIELVPPRLSWVSLVAELQTHTSGARGIYFVSSMNCNIIF